MTGNSKNGTWDIEISSSHSLLELKLKDIWRYRDLLMMFVMRDFKAFYKQTILGPFWFFIQPLFTTAAYIFIFGKLAGLSSDGIPQPLFYLAGITAWSYFQDCLLKTSGVFRDGAQIFGKVYFPRIIYPLSIIISNLIRFGVQFILLIVVYIYHLWLGIELSPSMYIFLLPFFVILLAFLGLGFGMIISSLATKYRDLALLISFGAQLLMYCTTVVYPLSSLSGQLRRLANLNPMSNVIEGMRLALFGAGTFDLYSLLYVIIFTALTVLIGLVIFNKVERNFIDTI